MTRPLSREPISTSFQGRPRPGDIVGGKYRIERELGRGGMGVVYEVTHLAMPQARFAIKWLQPFNDDDGLRRFRREARISGAIRHRHVIEVYDVNIDASGSYLVMELLEGETLAARIEREHGLSPTDACTILSQCSSGVAAAHAAGVIHRDIKPANIYLCATAAEGAVHPKVLDFGVSRVLSGFQALETTQTHGAIIGTPAYMAPEQLQARECDARTDVYALGVTLYEALAGQHAFTAASHADLVVRIVTGDVAPLRRVKAGLPAGLSDVVMRAMHKDPGRRYASVGRFAAALEPYGQPALVLGAASETKQPPRAPHLGWRSVVLGAGAAALAAAALLSAEFGRESETRAGRASVAGPDVPSQRPVAVLAEGEPAAAFESGKSDQDDSQERVSRDRDRGVDLVDTDRASRRVPEPPALEPARRRTDPVQMRGSVHGPAPRVSADLERSPLPAPARAQPREATNAPRAARKTDGRVAQPEHAKSTDRFGNTAPHETPPAGRADLASPPTSPVKPEQPVRGSPELPRPRPSLALDSL